LPAELLEHGLAFSKVVQLANFEERFEEKQARLLVMYERLPQSISTW
jgi:hypothetical protein